MELNVESIIHNPVELGNSFELAEQLQEQSLNDNKIFPSFEPIKPKILVFDSNYFVE